MSNIQELLHEEISRKEFIRYIGIALLGLIGVSAVLQNLSNTFGKSKQTGTSEADGYGMSAYGR